MKQPYSTITLRSMEYVHMPTQQLWQAFNKTRNLSTASPCMLPRGAMINHLLIHEFGADAVDLHNQTNTLAVSSLRSTQTQHLKKRKR